MNYKQYLDSLSQIQKNENILVYGAGSFSKTFVDQINHYRKDINIKSFLDKNVQGTFYGVEIIKPEELDRQNKDLRIIVCTSHLYWEEINKSLSGYNLYFNRFHDFNIYRRKESKYDIDFISSLFSNIPNKFNLLHQSIKDRNIKDILESKDLVDNLNDYYTQINLSSGDVVINGGGANGNENNQFIEAIGEDGVIYTFDPNHDESGRDSFNSKIKIFPYVLYNSKGKVGFHYEGSRSRIKDSSSNIVESISIDELVIEQEIERLDFITLDVEGSEKEILNGAKETIKKFKPKLAISVYHSTADFYEIPVLINEISNEYYFDLGIYDRQGIDTYLFARKG